MTTTTICTATEDCECSDCEQARADFDAWVEATNQRWEQARREGKVAHLCNGVLCPEHGDVRDTSAVR